MTVPQQRSQQQPWPSTVAQQRTAGPPPVQHRPSHAAPAPVPQATQARAADGGGRGGGSTAMTVLRVTTYVLTSIASLLFIVLVVYGVVKVNQLQDAFSSSPFGGGPTSSSYDDPNAGTRPAICDTDPTNAVCYGG